MRGRLKDACDVQSNALWRRVTEADQTVVHLSSSLKRARTPSRSPCVIITSTHYTRARTRFGFGMIAQTSAIGTSSVIYVAGGMTCRSGCTSFDFTAPGCAVMADTSIARQTCCVSSLPCVEIYSVNDIHTSSDGGRCASYISPLPVCSP